MSTSTPATTTAGHFVWHELMTQNQEASQAFFTDLFGWTVRSEDMGGDNGLYTMFYDGDQGIAGLVPLDDDAGLPSHWMTYASVDDVDDVVKQTPELGGSVGVAPFDIPQVGRMAVVTDPSGAHISPFKGESDEDAPGPSPFVWHELTTNKPEASKRFYSTLFGWGLDSVDMGEKGTYWLFKRDGQDAAGMMEVAGPEVPAHWIPYVAVPDVPAAAARITELGGQLFVPPTKMDEPANVHFAVAADPTGATFGLLES